MKYIYIYKITNKSLSLSLSLHSPLQEFSLRLKASQHTHTHVYIYIYMYMYICKAIQIHNERRFIPPYVFLFGNLLHLVIWKNMVQATPGDCACVTRSRAESWSLLRSKRP